MKKFSPGTGSKSLCSTGTGLNGIIDVVSAVCMRIYMYLYTYVCMCKATFKHPYGSVPSNVYRWTWSAAHLTAGLQHCLVRTYMPSCFAWEMNSCRKQTVLKAKEIEEILFFSSSQWCCQVSSCVKYVQWCLQHCISEFLKFCFSHINYL